MNQFSLCQGPLTSSPLTTIRGSHVSMLCYNYSKSLLVGLYSVSHTWKTKAE